MAKKPKKFYHATDFVNLHSIMYDGIRPGCDGVVYLAETPEDALNFVVFRCYEEILVVEIELEESEVKETFDHSYTFFKCKAFGYPGTIHLDSMVNFWKYF